MLSSLKNIFKIPDLRNKILFTIMMIAVYRFGTTIRVPGIDHQAIKQLQDAASTQGAIGFLNLFSGGAFESFSIFALGIMPYITSSIIMQILGVVIPKLEQLQQQGAVGQRKITQYTRYVTIALATLQATGLVFVFGTGRGAGYLSVNAPSVPILPDGLWPRAYLIIPTLVAGTAVLMWMGELISQRGIGNGMSMIIFASVVAGMPYGFWSILVQDKYFWFIIIVGVTLAIIVAVVYIELGQRRIPVQFAKRVVGRRMYGGQNTYIPLKVNQSGVIPVIFASSILLIPVIATNVLGNADSGLAAHGHRVGQRVHRQPAEPRLHHAVRADDHRLRLLLQHDRLRPGSPGRPDSPPGRLHPRRPPRSADRALPRPHRQPHHPARAACSSPSSPRSPTSSPGRRGSKPLGFAGTSLLIAVGVALEVMRQIDSQLTLRNYEGFLK